jgi:anaerobic magnesium-protoporphyrin IX monomethyl ester cyclase
MYSDLFTVSRDQVMELCEFLIQEKLNIKWTSNSRVDYVDEEMLKMMARAGCWLISWGIESGNEQILATPQGLTPTRPPRPDLG